MRRASTLGWALVSITALTVLIGGKAAGLDRRLIAVFAVPSDEIVRERLEAMRAEDPPAEAAPAVGAAAAAPSTPTAVDDAFAALAGEVPEPPAPGHVRVPDVSGETADVAVARMRAAGLELRVLDESWQVVPRPDRVVYEIDSVRPAAGTEVELGSRVRARAHYETDEGGYLSFSGY